MQGITPAAITTYNREFGRLKEFAAKNGVYTIQGVNRELLTDVQQSGRLQWNRFAMPTEVKQIVHCERVPHDAIW